MSRRFEGRVAVVAGVGPVGRAVAERFGSEGAAVVVGDRDWQAAEAAAAGVRAAGGVAEAVNVDVAEETDVRQLMDVADRRFRRLDILHNNVGMSSADDADLVDTEFDVWSRVLLTNAGGVMLGCKHAVPLMKRSGGGAIINTASVAGLWGDEVLSAYGSSKAAIMTLTKYVATMYGSVGVRCNAVAPSLILSDPVSSRLAASGLLLELEAERLLESPASPEEIAGVVAWLASDEARGITGQTIVVDSGTTAHRHRHAFRRWEAVRSSHPSAASWGR